MKKGKIKLTDIEKKCLKKFYLDEAPNLFRGGNADFKALGLEGAYETILKLAEEKPPAIQMLVKNEKNFVVLFDAKLNGEFEPVYIIKNGKKEF